MTSIDAYSLRKEVLDTYNNLNKFGNEFYSSKKFTMDNSVDEIQNELSYIRKKKAHLEKVTHTKKGIMLLADTVQAVCKAINVPCEWSREVSWDIMRSGKYDATIDELCRQYNFNFEMSPLACLASELGRGLAFDLIQSKQVLKLEKAKKRQETLKTCKEYLTFTAQVTPLLIAFTTVAYIAGDFAIKAVSRMNKSRLLKLKILFIDGNNKAFENVMNII